MEPTYPVGTPPFAVVEQNVVVELGEYCCDAPLDYNPPGEFLPGDEVDAVLYRPDVSARPLPMVIFTKAQGAEAGESEAFFERLASNGYLVLSLDQEGAGSDADHKTEAATCAIRWLQTDVAASDYASCDVVLMGQSSGGWAAWEAGRVRHGNSEPYWGDAELRALILIAAGTGNQSMVPFAPGDEVPLQVLSGATDEQEPHALYWYELMFEEPAFGLDAGKSLVWAYGFDHFSWGGNDPTTTKGELVGAYYANAFLDREVARLGSVQDWMTLNGEGVYPEELLAPDENRDHWEDFPGFTDYSGGVDCRDLTTQGTCEATEGCFWVDFSGQDPPPSTCVNRPLVFTATTPSAQLGDNWRVVEDFEDSGSVAFTTDLGQTQTEIGPVLDLIDPFTDPMAGDNSANYHATGALRVQFDGNLPTGSIRFPVDPPVGVSFFSHLTIRAGNLVDMADTTPSGCSAQQDERVDLEVELVPAATDGQPRTLDAPPLVQQDYRVTTLNQVETCNHQVMMQSLRFPLGDFCDQGQFGGEIEEVVIHFPPQPQSTFESNVLIDSIEFTSTPEDVQNGAQCALAPSAWECEATGSLTATETACADEPMPSCTTTQTAVALPEQPAAGGGTFDGWIVHAPWLGDPQAPTSSELLALEELCVAACEQQWSDDPAVTANCNDSGVFQTARLANSDSIGPVRQIPAEHLDGSELFQGQSLACDLTSTCAQEFDERLAMAAPRRPTPAEQPLGVGQEYVVELDTSSSQLVVDANGTQDSVQLYGEFGYSFCPEGSAVDPCPFYLGSLEVKSIGSITVPFTCPWGTNNVTLYDIDIHLGQPAFGISEGGSDMVAFPAGSLLFDATFKQNLQEHHVRGTNQVDIVLEAGTSVVEALQIPVQGSAEVCGGMDSLPAEGTFDVVLDLSGGTVERPPTVTIDIPSTVTCNSTVDLDATVSDPDGDLSSTRWYIDDQLIAASTTSIRFSTGHEVRAVARDARGAATTATKSISCVP